MAIPVNDLVAELQALVASVWTDIVGADGPRIRTEEHIATIPFDELASQGLPYAVLVIPAPEVISLGLANRCFLLRCEAWWVGETAMGSEEQREHAEDLASALWATARSAGLTNGQFWPEPMVLPSWGMDIPVNETLRSMKLPVLAGGVVFGVVVGEQGA